MEHVLGYGVVCCSFIAVRAEPSHRSEMVNQLLFGEKYLVLDEHENWLHIASAYDNYKGWIQYQTSAPPVQTAPAPSDTPHPNNCFTQTPKIITDTNNKNPFLLLTGSSLPNYNGEIFEANGNTFSVPEIETNRIASNRQILQNALLYLNIPYLWGGRSHAGIDCSGLVQVVFKMAQIQLPRDAYQQAEIGTIIDLKHAQVGDLAFFCAPNSPTEKITHVGIVAPQNTLLHASTLVHIDLLTQAGIVHAQTQKITHKLLFIKKIIP